MSVSSEIIVFPLLSWWLICHHSFVFPRFLLDTKSVVEKCRWNWHVSWKPSTSYSTASFLIYFRWSWNSHFHTFCPLFDCNNSFHFSIIWCAPHQKCVPYTQRVMGLLRAVAQKICHLSPGDWMSLHLLHWSMGWRLMQIADYQGHAVNLSLSGDQELHACFPSHLSFTQHKSARVFQWSLRD